MSGFLDSRLCRFSSIQNPAALFFKPAPLAFPALVIWNEHAFCDSVPNTLHFRNCPSFIAFRPHGVMLFESWRLGFHKTIKS